MREPRSHSDIRIIFMNKTMLPAKRAIIEAMANI